MKKAVLLALLFCFTATQAQQAFRGKGDGKFSVGAHFQNGGNGIQLSSDFGLGENLSYGLVGAYLLGVENIPGIGKPKFEDRVDVRLRINANLSSVFNIDEKLDIYPGLSLGLKNFGGHVGARYFFTDGFGIFSEASFPIAKYDESSRYFYNLHNQFTFTVGACFSM